VVPRCSARRTWPAERHVAKIVGVGSRRFDEPEEVADLVATVFLEVMESAGGKAGRRCGKEISG
jgi:hypothetical protein